MSTLQGRHNSITFSNPISDLDSYVNMVCDEMSDINLPVKCVILLLQALEKWFLHQKLCRVDEVDQIKG